MSLSDIIREIRRDYRRGKENPDQPATREEVAGALGIRHPEVLEDWQVPVELYREQDGTVTCTRSGRPPDPPRVIVARYQLPDGEKRVLASQEYADILQWHYPLDEDEADALARHRAGWDALDLEETMSTVADLGDILASAKETVEGADRAAGPAE